MPPGPLGPQARPCLAVRGRPCGLEKKAPWGVGPPEWGTRFHGFNVELPDSVAEGVLLHNCCTTLLQLSGAHRARRRIKKP